MVKILEILLIVFFSNSFVIAQEKVLRNFYESSRSIVQKKSIEGFYLKKGNVLWSQSFGYYFFSNGIYYNARDAHNSDFKDVLSDTVLFVEQINEYFGSCTYANGWGFYRINNDTLICQAFYEGVVLRKNPRNTLETKFLIKGKTIYLIQYKYIYGLTKPKIEKVSDTTGFKRNVVTKMPNLSEAWFYNKSWFVK
jgi:hypothetical protein